MALNPAKKLLQFQTSKHLFERIVEIAAKHHSTVPGAILFIIEDWFRLKDWGDIPVDQEKEVGRIRHEQSELAKLNNPSGFIVADRPPRKNNKSGPANPPR